MHDMVEMQSRKLGKIKQQKEDNVVTLKYPRKKMSILMYRKWMNLGSDESTHISSLLRRTRLQVDCFCVNILF